MRYELSAGEWTAIRPMLPNKPRGVPRLNDRRVLNGIFLSRLRAGSVLLADRGYDADWIRECRRERRSRSLLMA